MKKILVVEDDTYLANAYRVKLVKSGFEIKNAFDGEEALEVLKMFIPDIILLDIVMPKKDGFETLREIKLDEKLKNIPVILCTNLGQKEDIDRGMQLGANEFFIKTDFPLSSLIEKIENLLNNKSS